MAVFWRQRGIFLLGHVRRVADDQIVTLPAETCEPINADRLHAVGDVLVFDIFARKRQRLVADVGKIDAPIRIVHGPRDADATRSGA